MTDHGQPNPALPEAPPADRLPEDGFGAFLFGIAAGRRSLPADGREGLTPAQKDWAYRWMQYPALTIEEGLTSAQRDWLRGYAYGWMKDNPAPPTEGNPTPTLRTPMTDQPPEPAPDQPKDWRRA